MPHGKAGILLWRMFERLKKAAAGFLVKSLFRRKRRRHEMGIKVFKAAYKRGKSIPPLKLG